MNLLTRLMIVLATGMALVGARAAETPSAEGLDFFEKKIRPLLTEQCFECHSAEKKIKGGLRLDARDGWVKGGDSGPALVPGEVEASLLIKAVRYRDKEFQMPPKRKLTAEQVADLEKWVKLGAPDPRTATVVATAKKTGISIAEGRKYWSFQLPKKVASPAVKHVAWPQSEVDRFILAPLEAKGIRPVADATPDVLLRRIYFDLTGLPPTPEATEAFVKEYANHRAPAIANVVDHLLASPQFGERWGRHWLDVARYGESTTLRGFVFKEAWRYRDYVIEAFNHDLPYDRFVREQIAGDLLPAETIAEQQRQLTATTFLALGNTNLEEQDKKQLEMDAADEQLDVISKAFLAQTVTCARCHDHKFDPIPTRDYYALVGILRNARLLIHENVSKWIELPLPLTAADEAPYRQQEMQVAALQEKIKTAKAAIAKLAANKTSPATIKPGVLAVKDLPGIIVDDAQAKLVGDWRKSQYSKNYIGDGYLEDEDMGKGVKTLTFIPALPRAGTYEVRLAFQAGTNRATNTPVTIFSADGEQTLRINQRETPPIDGRFVSLGQHKFEQNGQGFVIVANEGTKGHVIADAVQFIPIEMLGELAAKTNDLAKATSDSSKKVDDTKKTKTAKAPDAEVKQLEDELKKLNESGPKRPMVMSVKEEPTVGDLKINIRGIVHNLGETAPRGFLQVATLGNMPTIPANESGRRELGEWLTSRENPLPARVMVNRVWHWLFGVGLVRTMDNFGTTGEMPSHPELLDYLAVRFMDEGWSVKKLVREIMLSHTYQLASSATPSSQPLDPENRLFGHAHRRRLDAECIRDTMLLASGELKLDLGGATIKPGTTADYGYKYTDARRSVYVPALRNALPELFEAFDFADPSMVTGKRNTSTVAPQALFLLNHPFVLERAQAAAHRALATDTDDSTRIERAYRVTLGRRPTDTERKLALGFVTLPGDAKELEGKRLDAWAQFYQTLFASVDFRYVN